MEPVIELSDEELVYEMGQWEAKSAKNEDRVQKLIDEALERELLVPDNSLGDGWRVLDGDGINTMLANAKDCVFDSKGIAWCYWIGLGRPHGGRMYAISDPLAEEEALANGERVEIGDIELVYGPPGKHLSIVKDEEDDG